MSKSVIDKVIQLIDIPVAACYLDSVREYEEIFVRLNFLNSAGVKSVNKNLAKDLAIHLDLAALKVMSDIYNIAVDEKSRHLLSVLLTDISSVASVFQES